MASRSPACLKSRGQNTVSSLQTNRPSLGRARKVVLLGRLDLWRQVARGLSVEDCGLRGRRNISEDDGAQIYRYSMGENGENEEPWDAAILVAGPLVIQTACGQT